MNELDGDKKPTTKEQQQATFLEQYATGTLTLEGAAGMAGVSASTIWRWRVADPEFDARVNAVCAHLDTLQVRLVRDAWVKRMIDGKCTATDIIFFLGNRAPDQWRSVNRVEHTGAGGGPIRTADLSKLSTAELEKLEQLLGKAGLELVA